MKPFVTDDDAEISPLGQFSRLMLFPVIVGLLFAGGVYWLRLQLDQGGTPPETTATVQVRLLPRPEPAPIPVASSSQPVTNTPHRAVEQTETQAASPSHDVLAAVNAENVAPADPPSPNVSFRSMTDAVPDSAMTEFRNALLRHIAKFQHYPRAAERQRLQGTVHAVFAVNRDGKLVGTWIKTSSGQTVLDQAAIDTIRRAQPLPPIPAALPDSIKVEVALGFDPS